VKNSKRASGASPAGRRRSRRRARLVVVLMVLAVAGWVAVVRTGALAAVHPGGTAGGQSLDPTLFATGSCVAYPPTQGDRGQTVFLDAGHGGLDPGGVGGTRSGTTIYEADETLPVELDVMALLRADGYRVVVSRTGPSTVLRLGPADTSDGVLSLQGAHDDVAARAQCADDANAQVLVGIYYNAGGSPQDAGSVAVYDNDRPFAADNLRLADLVQDDVLSGLNAQGWGIPNDGVQSDTGFGSMDGDAATGGLAEEAADYNHLMLIGPAMPGYFTTPSQMPGVVIEPLYITDPFEGAIAASSSGQSVIARGIASAVEHYLTPPPAASTSSTG
jgi:N-acetylmuramoyl-L-alanine amidase